MRYKSDFYTSVSLDLPLTRSSLSLLYRLTPKNVSVDRLRFRCENRDPVRVEEIDEFGSLLESTGFNRVIVRSVEMFDFIWFKSKIHHLEKDKSSDHGTLGRLKIIRNSYDLSKERIRIT